MKLTSDWNALMLASHYGDEEVVSLLIEHGTRVNDRTEKGWTALMLASLNCTNVYVITILLQNKADANVKTNYGVTALMCASLNWNIVKEIFRNTASEDLTPEDLTNRISMCSKNKETIKLLIQFGANVNERDADVWTALMFGLVCGFMDTVSLVYKAREFFKTSVENAKTDLERNIRNEINTNIQVLITESAEKSVKDIDGWNPLMIVSECGDILAVLQLTASIENVNEKKIWFGQLLP